MAFKSGALLTSLVVYELRRLNFTMRCLDMHSWAAIVQKGFLNFPDHEDFEIEFFKCLNRSGSVAEFEFQSFKVQHELSDSSSAQGG